jgi:hypothetical protein
MVVHSEFSLYILENNSWFEKVIRKSKEDVFRVTVLLFRVWSRGPLFYVDLL